MAKSMPKKSASTSSVVSMTRVTLCVFFEDKWYIHDSFTDPNALVQAVKQLCTNPEVKDFKVTPW